MKILFLTQWFQPENFFKGLPFAKALQARGHDVEVLTGFPNYPGGHVYPGYRVRCYQREWMDGIVVHRVPLYPSHDKSALRRIVNYLSFAVSSFLYVPFLIKKPDVIYVYNLITLGPTAFLLRSLSGAGILIDVQDLWPESVSSSRMLNHPLALNVLGLICNRIYRTFDRVTVLSPGFREEMIKRGVKPEKTEVIYNWCDETAIVSEGTWANSVKPRELDGKLVVLFAGAMGTAQGINTVLDCAELCTHRLPEVQFVFIGGGVERPRLVQRARDMRLSNVSFLPQRPMGEMAEIFTIADVLLVHLKDEPLFRITIPSKTQAYLYVGKPIIMAMRGDSAQLVRAAGAGVICTPGDPAALLGAIVRLRNMSAPERRRMGEAGRRYYLNHLAFRHGVDRFESIMLTLRRKRI